MKMSKPLQLPKWTTLLTTLYNIPAEQRYCERLHKTTGITTRHLRAVIADLEQQEMVKRAGAGKIKYLHLTEKGTQLAESLLRIYPVVKR